MFEYLGYCLFFYRFLTTVKFNIMSTLLSKELFACGTIQKNRRFHPSKQDKYLILGEHDSATAGSMSVTKGETCGLKLS